jgi:hypothetical protein
MRPKQVGDNEVKVYYKQSHTQDSEYTGVLNGEDVWALNEEKAVDRSYVGNLSEDDLSKNLFGDRQEWDSLPLEVKKAVHHILDVPMEERFREGDIVEAKQPGSPFPVKGKVSDVREAGGETVYDVFFFGDETVVHDLSESTLSEGTFELVHVGYVADREPEQDEIVRGEKIYTWSSGEEGDGVIDADLMHVGYVADREPNAHEIVKDGQILTWRDA